MKKQYPKVPNHYSDVVSDSFFTNGDLCLLEKLDGSNARVLLYDERYEEQYSDDVIQLDLSDQDVIIGSKRAIRGLLSDPIETFDGNFQRLLKHLRSRLDTDALYEYHTEYESPLVLFGEHMVKHTLDYQYEKNPPPSFLGFDVFRLNAYEKPPENPFDEDFTGFLSREQAWSIFESCNLETVRVIDKNRETFDAEQFTIPISSYGPVESEGVIIRSDERNERVKYVSEQFRERMHEAWGMRESEAETGEELFIARYVTNARIRKHVNKHIHETSTDDISTENITRTVVRDAWEEELQDIRTISLQFNPATLFDEAYPRVEEVINTMKTNAALNNTAIDRLWEDHVEDGVQPNVSTGTTETEFCHDIESEITDTSDVNVDLVQHLCPAEKIHSIAERHVSDAASDMGRWVIEPTYEDISEKFWYDNLDRIMSLDVSICPELIEDELLQYVTEEIEDRDDVVVSEKPDDWEPDPKNADGNALGELF